MKTFVFLQLICLLVSAEALSQAADPLPSWNDGPAKQAVVQFVERVTTEGSPDFVAPAERIATFDNDGTLWSEQPLYFQALFVFHRVKALAPQHPEWQESEPFASVLKGDLHAALAGGQHALLEMVMATHAGMTTEEFEKIVADWITTARHPTTGRLYTEMVYQPMLELLAYLRANGFKTYIVSGGGIEFVRPWSERVYGIPPEQVVGSSIKTAFEMREGGPVLARLPEVDFIDDKEGKPVGIHRHIGRRPIAAFGNSDGDLQMLQWTAAGAGPRFCLYIHHTDAGREWAYDRTSHIGKLDKGLDEAAARGWTVMDMAKDWNTIYPPVSAGAIGLLGTSWLVEDIGMHGVIDNAQTTISFDGAGGVSGSTGCNGYQGAAKLSATAIEFGPIATTRRACPTSLMDQESRFLEGIAQVRGYTVDANGVLYLNDAEGKPLMRLSMMEPR